METGLVITALIKQDKETGFYVAYCAEFPEAMSQGKTEKEAIDLLMELIPHVLHDRKEDAVMALGKNTEYKERELNFALAV